MRERQIRLLDLNGVFSSALFMKDSVPHRTYAVMVSNIVVVVDQKDRLAKDRQCVDMHSRPSLIVLI